MDAFDPNTIQLTIYGLGSVGALSVSFLLVNWLKTLLELEGRAVRWLNTVVAAYVVAMLYAARFWPELSLAMGALFLVAVIATATDALYARQKTTVEGQWARVRGQGSGVKGQGD